MLSVTGYAFLTQIKFLINLSTDLYNSSQQNVTTRQHTRGKREKSKHFSPDDYEPKAEKVAIVINCAQRKSSKATTLQKKHL